MTTKIEAQMPPEKTIIINNSKIAYYEQGKGETIILLHGWPQTSYVWRKVMPELSKKYRTIAVDLPGLGNSDKTESYDTKSIATIIDSFVDSLNINKFHLVGHDIGSWVAVPFAINFENKLKTLTVIDAGIPGLIPSSLFQPENANKVWQFYFHAVDEIPEFLTEGKEKEYLSWYFSKKSFIKTAISETDLQTYYLAYKGKERMKNGFDYYRAFNKSVEQNKKIESKLSIPVLAIGGEYAVSNQISIAMEKIATNVTTEVISSCGHYVPEEQPNKFVELIEILIDSSK
nr:alpha/beta hydrolase [uncultured Draconibacterium sp.]